MILVLCSSPPIPLSLISLDLKCPQNRCCTFKMSSSSLCAQCPKTDRTSQCARGDDPTMQSVTWQGSKFIRSPRLVAIEEAPMISVPGAPRQQALGYGEKWFLLCTGSQTLSSQPVPEKGNGGDFGCSSVGFTESCPPSRLLDLGTAPASRNLPASQPPSCRKQSCWSRSRWRSPPTSGN